MARTINSPGVEIREVDLSNRTNIPTGTNVLVAGFTAQGPTDDLVNVTSISELEQVYGAPTNAAERYFYYSAVQLLQANANVLVSRVPYGSGNGDGYANTYSALAFPIYPLSAASLSTAPLSTASLSSVAYKDANEFYIGAPTYLYLTDAEYDLISQGIIDWQTRSGTISSNSSIGYAGLIILNEAKVTIDEKFQGYYFGLADNSNLDPTTPFDDVTGALAWNNGSSFVSVPSSRLNFALSSVNGSVSGYQPNSTSEIIESIPTFDIGTTEFVDTLIFGVFKLRPSVFSQDVLKLEQQLEEGYTASFDSNRQIQSQTGGPAKSFFVNNVVNGKSPNIRAFVNPNISSKSAWADVNGNPAKRVRVYRSLANYATQSGENYTQRFNLLSAVPYLGFADSLYTFSVYLPQLSIGTGSKNIGSLPDKLNRILRKAENFELYPLDITIDGGLSTIWSSFKNVTLGSTTLSADGIYDDTLYFNLSADSTNNLYRTDGGTNIGTPGQDWLTIYNIFDTFARQTRRDHLHISDPLRQIVVQGQDLKIEDAKYIYGQRTNFSQHVYWPLKNLYGTANSSYSTAYANWVKVYDSFSDTNVWVPFSGYAANLMVNTDRNFQPWFSPAGLTRGVVTGVLDIATNPQQKERDLIEKVAINSLYFSPSDGYVILSERTLQKKPSALDRIHVRRLFLVLEKATYQVSKYFVQEPNTTFTRARLVNALNPIFKLALDTQGLYDYLIVCDERNNTANTIDNNELHVDIYLKPVRSAEFILINFFATRTDQNFNELV